MEIELKLKLPESTSHEKLSDLLSPFHIKTHLQENIFFDGLNSELSAKRAVLRLRFYNDDSICVVSLKAKAVLVNGVSRVEEDEEKIDPVIGRACVLEPLKLLGMENCKVLKRVKDEFFSGEGEKGFACLGGFRNVRGVSDEGIDDDYVEGREDDHCNILGLAVTILYLQQLLGMNDKVIQPVVSALLLLSDDSTSAGGAVSLIGDQGRYLEPLCAKLVDRLKLILVGDGHLIDHGRTHLQS